MWRRVGFKHPDLSVADLDLSGEGLPPQICPMRLVPISVFATELIACASIVVGAVGRQTLAHALILNYCFTSKISKMKKSIDLLVGKSGFLASGSGLGRYGHIRGGFGLSLVVQENTGCSNPGACKATNFGQCVNAGECTGTNLGFCANTSCPS